MNGRFCNFTINNDINVKGKKADCPDILYVSIPQDQILKIIEDLAHNAQLPARVELTLLFSGKITSLRKIPE